MPKAGSRTAKPTRTKPATNSEETPEAACRRLAGELQQCHLDAKAHIESLDDLKIDIEDLKGILVRDYPYHALRAEELRRELLNYGTNV